MKVIDVLTFFFLRENFLCYLCGWHVIKFPHSLTCGSKVSFMAEMTEKLTRETVRNKLFAIYNYG